MMTGVKFLFRGTPHFLQVMLEETVARAMIRNFLDGKCPPILGDFSNPKGAWSVVTSEVAGIHAFSLENLQQAPANEYNPFSVPKQ